VHSRLKTEIGKKVTIAINKKKREGSKKLIVVNKSTDSTIWFSGVDVGQKMGKTFFPQEQMWTGNRFYRFIGKKKVGQKMGKTLRTGNCFSRLIGKKK
jgi:hypothetical protein